MSDKTFVDTNILLYARDSSESEKQMVALDLLAHLWDSLIVAAADTAGCAVILSEDLSSSQDDLGMQVINPFKRELT